MEQPKYQWNFFVDSNKNEQFVIRCDDPTEFLEAIRFVQSLLVQRNTVQETEPEPEPDIPPDQCQIHNRPMKKRQGKSGAQWYDHRWQDEAGVWHSCNGKTTQTQQTQ
jgi:hypothetical protein